MARQKLGREHIRSLTTMGGGRSVGLTLPIAFIRDLGWNPRQKVRVVRRGKELAIKNLPK